MELLQMEYGMGFLQSALVSYKFANAHYMYYIFKHADIIAPKKLTIFRWHIHTRNSVIRLALKWRLALERR